MAEELKLKMEIKFEHIVLVLCVIKVLLHNFVDFMLNLKNFVCLFLLILIYKLI